MKELAEYSNKLYLQDQKIKKDREEKKKKKMNCIKKC